MYIKNLIRKTNEKKLILLILFCLSFYFFKEISDQNYIDKMSFITWKGNSYLVQPVCEYKREYCYCHAYELKKDNFKFTLRDKDCNFLKENKKANVKESLLSKFKFNTRINKKNLNHKEIYIKIEEERLYYFSFDKKDNLLKNNAIGNIFVIN